MKNDYRTKLSFMTSSELISEYESVSDICKYVSIKSDYHTKLSLVKQELKSRKLEAVIA